MERSTGPPLGAATLSSGRIGFDGNMARPPGTARRVPAAVRQAPSTSSLSSPRSEAQVIALAREAMKNAIEENRTKAAEASGVSTELKPGVTIDLSHKQIQKFPEEVVDIIKTELERLALSHNQISSFPLRFAECTSLRYLNVRNNFIREFPLPICELTSLEILDLGRNKLRALPDDIVRLTSLKVLSVQKNRIEELPLCIGDMIPLQVLKLDGNPLRFPPREVLQPQMSRSPSTAQEGEFDDLAVTLQIKKFMKQQAIGEPVPMESGGEESSEGTETPRPTKRVTSGRFPVKVNGADIPDLRDMRSPGISRPPPIPNRSHYRGLSQQNSMSRRPGVMPLTIGNTNERVRSNSEGLLQATRDRSGALTPGLSDRSRRMGIVSKKASELGTVEETKTNRYSHYRGLSHGSAMQGGSSGTNGNSRSPVSPADSAILRATYVRRLSSLPERKRESSSPDPVLEGAKGVLFALFQVHPLIQTLLGLAREDTNRRTSLERVFYNATTHVEELDRNIQDYDTYSEEDEENSPRSNENVRRVCMTCIDAYIHVLHLLSSNSNALVQNGDPRYIRTFMLQLYGSLMEVNNARTSLFQLANRQPSQSRDVGQPSQSVTERQERQPSLFLDDRQAGSAIAERQSCRPSGGYDGTVRVQPHARDKSVTPTRERPGPGLRTRSEANIQHPNNLRVAVNNRPLPYVNGSGRSATMVNSTPRSGDSFISSSSGRATNGEFTEEDRTFETIFLKLQQSSEHAIKDLPIVSQHFVTAMNICNRQASPDQPKQFWQALISKTNHALHMAEQMKFRLSLIKLKEPGVRNNSTFWELCNLFLSSYVDLAIRVKEAKSVTVLLPNDVIHLLRPLQKVIRETSHLIEQSPWSLLSRKPANEVSNGSYTTQSPNVPLPLLPVLPMTPQSAALGPAVQATVPSTPQSASFGSVFNGDVFQRADTLLSMSGGSLASSRAGTMNSSFGANDGPMSSMLSPINGNISQRFNGNPKLGY